jgi:hypothetical protein
MASRVSFFTGWSSSTNAESPQHDWRAWRDLPIRSETAASVWLENYLQSAPADLPRERRPEVTLSVALAGHRLVAKFDLLASDPGRRVVIVDWKTWHARPDRVWLAARLQTRVYRYVLVEGGAALNGGQRWQPDQVEMVYWFADHPDRPERLPYSERSTTPTVDTGVVSSQRSGTPAKTDSP